MKDKIEIKQGDIVLCDLDGALGSEQNGDKRPCLVIQNWLGNTYSSTTIIAPLTKQNKGNVPQHFSLTKHDYPFLLNSSFVLLEQLRCVDIGGRISRVIGSVTDEDLIKIVDLVQVNFKLKESKQHK